MRYRIVLSLLAGLPAVLFAFSTGPPIKRTGAAVDGGLNCTACHASFAPANSEPFGSVSITYDTPTYKPGVSQMVHVSVKNAGAARWGFQLTARPVSNQTIPAGTFAPTSNVRVRCDVTPAADAPCNGALEFAEHNNAPRTDVGLGFTFDVPWTPPATDVGDVIFYFAGNAANGDGTFNGDHIYTGARTISSSSACTAALAAKPVIGGMVNAASGQAAWSSNSILSIFGSGFANAGFTRAVTPGDISADLYPTQLSCVAVEINGQRAPLTYVQSNQINVQAPTLSQTGSATITVIMNPGTAVETRSSTVTVNTLQNVSPACFTLNGTSIAALSTTGNVIADPKVVSTGQFAKPGDIISIYGTGFGVTNPAVATGAVVTSATPLALPVSVSLGGVTLPASSILYAGLSPGSISGLYQLNIQIPANTPAGNVPVVITVGGVASSSAATIPVQAGS